jgi:hypothetical protein
MELLGVAFALRCREVHSSGVIFSRQGNGLLQSGEGEKQTERCKNLFVLFPELVFKIHYLFEHLH